MIPQFTTKEELSDFIANEMNGDKSRFMKLRKSSIKHADAVSFNYSEPNRDEAVKELGASEDVNPTELRVKVVINTTNILDSHGDVHIPGLWNKSLKENKSLLHLQEHKQAFANQNIGEKSQYQNFTIPEANNLMFQFTDCTEVDLLNIEYKLDYSHVEALQADEKQKSEVRRNNVQSIPLPFSKGLINYGRAMELLEESDSVKSEYAKLFIYDPELPQEIKDLFKQPIKEDTSQNQNNNEQNNEGNQADNQG